MIHDTTVKSVEEQLEEIDAEEKALAANAEREQATKTIAEHELKQRFAKELLPGPITRVQDKPWGRVYKDAGDEAFAIADTDGGFVVFKSQPAAIYKRFRATKMKDADTENFILQHLAHPERDKALSILNRYHGAQDVMLAAVCKLHGTDVEAKSKK